MLLFGSRLLHTPITSLHTGAQLALLEKPIIDPANLHIVAYEVSGDLLSERPSFLATRDIREYGRYGMLINSNDDIVGLSDVIKIQQLYELGFPLVGLLVVREDGHKIGKVSDYSLDIDSFVIQQLHVRQGLLKGITDTGLIIGRSQIIEINNTKIVVRSPTVKTSEPVMEAIRGEFVNPFRTTAPSSNASPSDVTAE